MAMLPIFVIGVIIGSMLTFAYIKYKKDTPSQIKIDALHDIIDGLKEDIAVLEDTNNDLRKQLKESKMSK